MGLSISSTIQVLWPLTAAYTGAKVVVMKWALMPEILFPHKITINTTLTRVLFDGA
jgi:hypothetical protein